MKSVCVCVWKFSADGQLSNSISEFYQLAAPLELSKAALACGGHGGGVSKRRVIRLHLKLLGAAVQKGRTTLQESFKPGMSECLYLMKLREDDHRCGGVDSYIPPLTGLFFLNKMIIKIKLV